MIQKGKTHCGMHLVINDPINQKHGSCLLQSSLNRWHQMPPYTRLSIVFARIVPCENYGGCGNLKRVTKPEKYFHSKSSKGSEKKLMSANEVAR